MCKRIFKSNDVLSAVTVTVLTVLCAIVITGCTTQTTQPGTSISREIHEVRPGILDGYIAEDELPDSLALLPPPP